MRIDTQRRPSGIQQLRRLLAAVLVAAALAGAGSTLAQDASDSTDVEIGVLPGTATPVVVPPQPTMTPHTPTAGEPTPAPAGMPLGTVSARFVLWQENTLSQREHDVIATMIVRDERGTAAGWTVAVSGDPAISPEQSLALLENLDGTVWRIIPADGRQSEQVLGIQSGHTVGILVPAIPFLHAALGSGSGVFQQNVIVIVPEHAPALATLTVQITTSP